MRSRNNRLSIFVLLSLLVLGCLTCFNPIPQAKAETWTWKDEFTDQNSRWNWDYNSGTGSKTLTTKNGFSVVELKITAQSVSTEYSDDCLQSYSKFTFAGDKTIICEARVQCSHNVESPFRGSFGFGFWDGLNNLVWFLAGSPESDEQYRGFRAMVRHDGQYPLELNQLLSIDLREWHTLRIESSSNGIVFKIDGVAVASTPYVMNKSMYIAIWHDNNRIIGTTPTGEYLNLTVDEISWVDYIAYREETGQPDNWTLNISADAGGTVSPTSATGAPGTSTPAITATANSGYTFSHWLYDGTTEYTSNPLTLTINDGNSHTLQAVFSVVQPENWTLSISAGTGGTVSPTAATGAPDTSTPAITATPNTGYTFSYWLYDGATQYTQNPLTLTIDDADVHTLRAVFSADVLRTFGKTAEGRSVLYGSFTNRKYGCRYPLAENGAVEKISLYARATGTGCYVRAAIYEDSDGRPEALIAVSDEVLVKTRGWYDFAFPAPPALYAGDYWLSWIVQSTLTVYYDNEGERQFTHNNDAYSDGFRDPFGGGTLFSQAVSVYATYSPEIVQPENWTLNISAGAGGTVSPTSATGAPGTSTPAITATANSGYTFSHWLYDETNQYTDNPLTLTINDENSHTLQAVFSVVQPENWTLSISAGNGGTVSPTSATGASGTSTPSITATANTGYTFSYWLYDGITQYTENPITLTIDDASSHTLQAVFSVVQPQNWTLSISAGTGGTVSPTSATGAPDTSTPAITATPNTGYTFSYWLYDGATQYMGNPLILTISDESSHTLEAVFAEIPPETWTLTISVSPAEGGYTVPSGTITGNVGDTVTIRAYPNAGYRFDRWIAEGTETYYNNPVSGPIISAGDHTLEAHFIPIAQNWTLSISAGAGGTVSPTSATGASGTSTPAITAIANSGYTFSYWLYDGTTEYTSNPLTLTINDGNSHTLEAVFTAASALTVVSPNGGESWGRGTMQTITWTSGGDLGAYVRIELLKGGTVYRIIAYWTANDGSYNWRIPWYQGIGTDYTIKITSISNPSITDSSDNNFAITR